jgi:hypothetical protein
MPVLGSMRKKGRRCAVVVCRGFAGSAMLHPSQSLYREVLRRAEWLSIWAFGALRRPRSLLLLPVAH